MTLNQALEKELKRGMSVIASVKDAPCQVCGDLTELRAGVCWDCKEKIETDMIEVWEIADPQHRWPYVYRGNDFRDVDEATVNAAQKIAEQFGKP